MEVLKESRCDMKLIEWIKGVIGKMFKSEAKKQYGINAILSTNMESAISAWYNIVAGNPEWIDKGDDIDTINFAKFITTDTAKKVCLDIDINIDGSKRAEYLQEVIDELKHTLRNKVEDACALGGIIFKPNGSTDANSCIDYVQVTDFLITEKTTNGDIRGAVFFDYRQNNDIYYTRMEYHRFINGSYVVSNKAFASRDKNTIGKEVSLAAVEVWSNLQPETTIKNIDKPLFAYFKMPYNNTIDYNSPLGVSVFSNAIKELRDLDIAWSRKSGEIEDSKHITFVDQSTMMYADQNNVTLPRFVKAIDFEKESQSVREHVATLLTDDRIKDINSILSMISTKCGFSQGQFILDRKTGQITATQVEADDRETIETIKDIRDNLKVALEQLIYALDVYASLYDYAPLGNYETSYAFGDLTYNWEEDRARHWTYVTMGKYPLYRYYMKFEGMSEEEAKKTVAEAQGEQTQDKDNLFEKE